MTNHENGWEDKVVSLDAYRQQKQGGREEYGPRQLFKEKVAIVRETVQPLLDRLGEYGLEDPLIEKIDKVLDVDANPAGVWAWRAIFGELRDNELQKYTEKLETSFLLIDEEDRMEKQKTAVSWMMREKTMAVLAEKVLFTPDRQHLVDDFAEWEAAVAPFIMELRSSQQDRYFDSLLSMRFYRQHLQWRRYAYSIGYQELISLRGGLHSADLPPEASVVHQNWSALIKLINSTDKPAIQELRELAARAMPLDREEIRSYSALLSQKN